MDAMAGSAGGRGEWLGEGGGRDAQAVVRNGGAGDADQGTCCEPDRVTDGVDAGGGSEEERGHGSGDGAPRRALGGAASVDERVEAAREHEWAQQGGGPLADAEEHDGD